MRTLRVDLPGREYDIRIEHGSLDAAGEHIQAVCPRAKKAAVVSDSNVAPLYYNRLKGSLLRWGFEESLFVLPAGEKSKNAAQLTALWEWLMEFGLTRSDVVIALGGGVVGDLSGFAAATVLRGVDFVQVPTTLLAQVDSSVGGKTAIDLAHGKNLAGTFHQPKAVLMDPDTLATLPDATFADGMAEVIKYGCIADEGFFEALEAAPSRAGVMADIENVLYTCCDIKRKVVIEDERDTGVRMVLNFGHTLGHAYELAGHYETWSHGQAVAAGMVKAAGLGARLGVTPAGTAERIAALTGVFGLPASIACAKDQYAAAVGLDKKGVGSDITLVLPEGIGRATLRKLPKAELLAMLEEKL